MKYLNECDFVLIMNEKMIQNYILCAQLKHGKFRLVQVVENVSFFSPKIVREKLLSSSSFLMSSMGRKCIIFHSYKNRSKEVITPGETKTRVI